MAVKIGFAILSHNEPAQALRLVRTLNAMFGDPPIVCHHDFSQCPLDERLFPGNVEFAHPHIPTRWGNFSLPKGAFAGLSLLLKYSQVEWFVLLSACDYPVRPPGEILDGLSNPDWDAYADHREIQYGILPPGQTAEDGGYDRPSWIPLAYDRYCAVELWWPRPSKKLLLSGAFPFRKKTIVVRNPYILKLLQRYRPVRIFAGDFWVQLNRKALSRIVADPETKRIEQYYSSRVNTAESFFQTALCNQPDLRICKQHRRYADWRKGGPHPKWLEVEDVPTIVESGAFFARKFRPDGITQDYLDRNVLGIAT
jgi:hypothetical protein